MWTLLGLLCVITAGVVKKKKKKTKTLGTQSAESIVRHQLYSHHDEFLLARSLAGPLVIVLPQSRTFLSGKSADINSWRRLAPTHLL